MPRVKCDEVSMSRSRLNDYGSLEPVIRAIRDHRPLDLNTEQWRNAHPDGIYRAWQALARECLLEGLHYDPGKLNMDSAVLETLPRDGYTQQLVAFNTTPWNRVKGYFLLPDGIHYPVPGLVVFHAWGGPMLFGKERVVNSGRDHPLLAEHRKKVYSGQYLAEVFAKRGYAVIVIDAYHFGERTPHALNGIPAVYDPFDLPINEYVALDQRVRDQLYLGVRQLAWAGTTWAGINYWDDSRCIDYLLSRPEVDPDRIGCTGLSGGGWRANMLAALDPRVRAAVSVGWMTTGDTQQVYNVAGAIGTFCLLPGVWNRLDVPDLIAMSAPCASMVVSGTEDPLFPPEGQAEAARQIRDAFEWAGCPERYYDYRPHKPHCYDAEIQQQAIGWFDQHLK